MNAVKKLLLIFLFVAILFFENAFFIQKYYIFISLKMQMPSLLLKEKTDAFLKCLNVKQTGIAEDVPEPGSVLSMKEGILTVSGNATPGSIVVDNTGKIAGKVIKTERKIFYVATPFSRLFVMNVTVGSSPTYEGRLMGGFPPLLEVVENVNLNGKEIWISEEEKYGFYLRSKGEGYLGKVKGKDKDLWIVDYVLPNGPFRVVGK